MVEQPRAFSGAWEGSCSLGGEWHKSLTKSSKRVPAGTGAPFVPRPLGAPLTAASICDPVALHPVPRHLIAREEGRDGQVAFQQPVPTGLTPALRLHAASPAGHCGAQRLVKSAPGKGVWQAAPSQEVTESSPAHGPWSLFGCPLHCPLPRPLRKITSPCPLSDIGGVELSRTCPPTSEAGSEFGLLGEGTWGDEVSLEGPVECSEVSGGCAIWQKPFRIFRACRPALDGHL